MGAEYSVLAYVQWRREGFKTYGFAGIEAAKKRWASTEGSLRPGTANPNSMRENLEGRNVVVTGANAGLGYCMAVELARRQARVHLLCRDKGRGEVARDKIITTTGNQSVHLHICDVSSKQSVKDFVTRYIEEYEDVYTLINNAGVMPAERADSVDGIEMSFATMAGGTFQLTGLLLPALQKVKDSRVINVSSAGMYNMKVNTHDLNSVKRSYDAAQVYAIAKRVQCDITKLWKEYLGESTPISVVSMHPGWAETDGVKKQYPDFYQEAKHMFRSPEQGADTAVWLTCCEVPPVSGEFYFDREIRPTSFKYTGTESTRKERIEVWNQLCEMYDWGKKL
eukprot:GHVN01106847.1.p1 GENE.GHVN01106847.1~~GHVN01106847.1.p1  ORF type:complete len:338 (+),score=54.88 GHVN01106847.1:233-1246(+)